MTIPAASRHNPGPGEPRHVRIIDETEFPAYSRGAVAPGSPCAQAIQAHTQATEAAVNLTQVRETAVRELREEQFRAAVEREKARIRVRRPWWHIAFPFKITVTRR